MGVRKLILLDTHIWIWFNLSPWRLPPTVAEEFTKPGAEFAVSSITIWETVMAAEKGRIDVAFSPVENVRAWLRENPLKIVPIDEEIAILARTLRFEHADPADRFIAATAFYLDCPIITLDEQLRKLPWLKSLPTQAS